MPPRARGTGIAIILLAAGAIAGAVGRPLALAALPVQAADHPRDPVAGRKCRAATVPALPQGGCGGHGVSLAGDVFLMLPQDLFVPGLMSFLVAHLCFIFAFFPVVTWPARIAATAAYTVVACTNLALLLPMVPPALHVPVLAYVCVLVVMAAFAAARVWVVRNDLTPRNPPAPPRLAVSCLSSATACWLGTSFRGGALAPLLVLVSYFGALWCIARSMDRVQQQPGGLAGEVHGSHGLA